ncbi:hypothetical protein QJS10_CPB21g00258 [Acorus calamus]|uniref:Uncharacterized protein n=1 Tax=Acorus calamus TaxID=4465 RepID=A0AAV9C8T0_ACOCL|nr:hypothetical protein QJS10_CPB21g00258 [Acorus calamus]
MVDGVPNLEGEEEFLTEEVGECDGVDRLPPQNPRNINHGLLPHRHRGSTQPLRLVDAGSTHVSDPSIGISALLPMSFIVSVLGF